MKNLHGLVTISLLIATAAAGEPLAQQPPLRTFSSIPQCANCSVQLRAKATLQVPTDSISFSFFSKVMSLRGGELVVWGVGGNRGPVVFDSSGRFRRFVAPVGMGPGEIRQASAIIRVPGDSVWIIDGSRLHVFSPTMRFVRQDRAGIGVNNIIAGPGGAVITSGLVGSRASAGYPLHMRNSAFEITRSFGTDDPTIDPRRMRSTGDDPQTALERNFTSDSPTTFWAYNNYRFLLERYDFQGRLLSRYRHALDGWYGEGTKREPSAGEFPGLLLDAVQSSSNPNIIWLVYHDPRPEFKAQTEGKVDHMKIMKTHDLVVEAFDVKEHRVIATGRWPSVFGQKVDYAPDTFALIQPLDDVFLTFRIVKLELVKPSS